MDSINTLISEGIIGRIVKPSNANPKSIIGKYQIKLDDPKIIGDEIIKPRIAFLESVKNIKHTKKIDMIKIASILVSQKKCGVGSRLPLEKYLKLKISLNF